MNTENKSKAQLENLIAELDAFLDSKFYSQFLFTLNIDRENLEEQILTMRPTTPESVAALNELHGTLSATISFLSFFDEARQTLKTNLSNVTEAAHELTKSKQ